MKKLWMVMFMLAVLSPLVAWAAGTLQLKAADTFIATHDVPDSAGTAYTPADSVNVTVVFQDGTVSLDSAWYNAADAQAVAVNDALYFFDAWDDMNGSDGVGMYAVYLRWYDGSGAALEYQETYTVIQTTLGLEDSSRVDGSILAATTGAITAATIATNAIGNAEIAASAIGADEIADNAIGVSEIATNAIGAAEIATGAIGASEIAVDAIGAAQIAANAIGSAEIAANAITPSEAPYLAFFDTLIYIGSRGLGIYLDSASGNTNTVLGVDGTASNPVSTIAAAKTLATALSVNRYYFLNASTFNGAAVDLASSHQNWEFIGVGRGSELAFGGQRVDNSRFEHLGLSGAMHASGGDVFYTYCTFGYITANFNGHADNSWLTDTIVVKAGKDIEFSHCHSGVAGNETPTIDFSGGSSGMSMRHYSGGIRILNGSSNDTISVETDGQLIIDASNTSLTVTARGMMTITDNGTTTSLTRDAALNGEYLTDLTWDEPNTSSDHNVTNSTGKQLRQNNLRALIHGGTSTGATSSTITLDGGASGTDGAYDPAMIIITGDPGAGQTRLIYGYNGTAKVAVVDRDWKVNPTSSQFLVLAHPGREHVNEGLVVGAAGSSDTVYLNALASSLDNVYIGQTVFLRAGTGADQSRRVIDYNGTSKKATIDPAWGIAPDATTAYVILPERLSGMELRGDVYDTVATLFNDSIPGLADTVNNLVASIWGDTSDVLGEREELLKVAGDSSGWADLADVWRNQDTTNVDSSDIGDWFKNNIAGSGGLDSTAVYGAVEQLVADSGVARIDSSQVWKIQQFRIIDNLANNPVFFVANTSSTSGQATEFFNNSSAVTFTITNNSTGVALGIAATGDAININSISGDDVELAGSGEVKGTIIPADTLLGGEKVAFMPDDFTAADSAGYQGGAAGLDSTAVYGAVEQLMVDSQGVFIPADTLMDGEQIAVMPDDWNAADTIGYQGAGASGLDTLSTAFVNRLTGRNADTVWKALLSDRDDVAGSFGDSAQEWKGGSGGFDTLSTAYLARLLASVKDSVWMAILADYDGVAGSFGDSAKSWKGINGFDSTVVYGAVEQLMADSQGVWITIPTDTTESGYAVSSQGFGPSAVTLYWNDTSGTDTPIGDVFFRVKNAVGTPVFAWSSETATGKRTLYFFDGSYTIESSKTGWRWDAYPLTVSGDNDSVEVAGFNVVIGSSGAPNVCRVYGYVTDVGGTAVQFVKVTATLPNDTYDSCSNTIVFQRIKDTQTRGNTGYFFLDLTYSSCLSGEQYEFTFEKKDIPTLTKKITVPDSVQHYITWDDD